MKTKEELPACPVATAVSLIGGKWKLLILRNLKARPWRFNELQRRLPEMTHATLAKQLRSLEEYGVITRTEYPQVPPKVEYALSPLGEEFRPVLAQFEAWGLRCIEHLGKDRG